MAEAGYCFQNAKIHIIYESNKFISTLPRYPAYGVFFSPRYAEKLYDVSRLRRNL